MSFDRSPLLSACWRVAVRLALCLALLARATPAAAEEGDERPVQGAAAEALFLEGRKLMAAEQFEEACRRFEESRNIEPAIGTTMNLARCYLKLGRTASAWLLYRDVAANARALGQFDREQHARRELALLEPELARLVIQAEQELVSDERVAVTLDGGPVPISMVGSEVPVDPGRHEVVVRTPRAELWTGQVEIAARRTERIVIPHLELPPESVVEERVATGADAPSADEAPAKTRWLTPRRKVALGFAAAATAGAAYAIFEAVRAANANADSDPDTCVVGASCTQAAIDKRLLAQDRAQRATIAAGVSAACAISAGVLWVLGAPPDAPVSADRVGSAWVVSYHTSW